MDSAAVTRAADLTATRFQSFSEATRGEASFDLEAGASIDLNESFCIRMAAGEAPNLANAAASSDPVYGSLAARDDLDIGSYAGVPLELGSGERIGSLCAIAHDLDAYSESDLQILRVLGSLRGRGARGCRPGDVRRQASPRCGPMKLVLLKRCSPAT